MRAQRLNIKGDNCHILAETDLNKIIEAITEIQSGVVVIDSVQTMYTPELESVPGISEPDQGMQLPFATTQPNKPASRSFW